MCTPFLLEAPGCGVTATGEPQVSDSPARALLEREWLLTNGLGDFASSTVSLTPTRRYHGLLVARPQGSEKRHVFLSRFEEEVRVDGEAHALSVGAYEDAEGSAVYAPRGDRALTRFELSPTPTWTFELPCGRMTREVLLARGARTVLLRYRFEGAPGAELRLRPLLPTREADALTFRNEAADPRARAMAEHVLAFQPYESLPALAIHANHPLSFTPEPAWFERVHLSAERARGYPAREDHLSPGWIRVPLEGEVTLAATLEESELYPAACFEDEARRRADQLQAARAACGDRRRPGPGEREARVRLELGAEDFFVERGGRLGIDAGFPWFGEWGRDTFLSLPGLTLARGDAARCARVLDESVPFLADGLLPNIFALRPEDSHYGSVDASLWFARAVELYDRVTGQRERVRTAWLPALLEIATCYWEGTGLGVHATREGLLVAGDPDSNPTWMDAVTPDGPVTPRHGCAVELNALWYALLHHLEELLTSGGDRAAGRLWRARRLELRRAFLERFWLEGEGMLADRWCAGEVDRAVRPNMVIAASLARSPLTKARRAAIVARAGEELLTPRGLRTLSPRDAAYRGRYAGDPVSRDSAYHQGTVWPFLFGFYVEAALRGRGATRPVREELRGQWCEVVRDLDERGLGHVSEVFDGDEPRRGGGTIAQAWNTAELLRADWLLRRRRP